MMFIPNTKTELVLKAPWSFRLYEETRNMGLVKSLGVSYPPWPRDPWNHYVDGARPSVMVTFPTGTVLKVARVYIRQGTADSYDSLTFTVKRTTATGANGKPVKGRFWAKLGDINGKMDAEAYFGEAVTPEESISRFALLFE